MKTNAGLPAPPTSQGYRWGQTAWEQVCRCPHTPSHHKVWPCCWCSTHAPPTCGALSSWRPTHCPAAFGFHVLVFPVAGTVDHSLLLKAPSFLAAGTPPSPPSSTQLLCPFSLCNRPDPLACRPTLLLALVYPQAITTTLALKAICQQIK